MKSPFRAAIIAACLPLAAACDNYHYRYFGAVDPTPVRVATTTNSNWRADATVVSSTALRGCSW